MRVLIALIVLLTTAGAWATEPPPFTAHALERGQPLHLGAVEQGGGRAERACLYAGGGHEKVVCTDTPDAVGEWSFVVEDWAHGEDYGCRLENAAGRGPVSNAVTVIDSAIGLRCGLQTRYGVIHALWCSGPRGWVPGCATLRRSLSLFETGCP